MLDVHSSTAPSAVADVEAYAEYSRELLTEAGSGFQLVSQLLHRAGERPDPPERGAVGRGGGGGGERGGGSARLEADACGDGEGIAGVRREMLPTLAPDIVRPLSMAPMGGAPVARCAPCGEVDGGVEEQGHLSKNLAESTGNGDQVLTALALVR